MANITALLAALSNLPPVGGRPALPPLPGTVQPPPDFNLPMSLTGPEPPPAAPSMPIDQSLIQRYLQFAGPAPTPPPPMAPAGKLDKIAAALLGINAGFQGQGPQFAASLRAERERPQREFEARQQQYEQTRRQLGLRGFEAAQDAEEKRQARQERLAERQFERDFQEFTRRNNITDQMALEKMREAAQIQRDAERERAMDEKLERQQKAQQERDARIAATKYRLAGAKDSIATELGKYDALLIDQLSPAAAKWESTQAKVAEARAARLARIGTGGGGGGMNAKAMKAYQQFESLRQDVAAASARGDVTTETQLRGQMKAAFNRLARFPGQFDLSYDASGQWPTAKPRAAGAPQAAPPLPGEEGSRFQGPPVGEVQPQAAQPAAPGQKSVTSQQIQDAARKAGISYSKAAKQFTDAGYRISL